MPPEELNELVECYNNTLRAVLDKYAPIIEKKVVIRENSPWFTDEIKIAKTERRKAERRWRLSKLTVDLNSFRNKHNIVKQMCQDAKSSYHCNKIAECEKDQKQLYQIANTLLHRKPVKILPSHTSEVDRANGFADYFTEKVQSIQRSFGADEAVNTRTDILDETLDVPKFSLLDPLSKEELEKLILTGNSKSCCLDPVPTSLLKTILSVLSPVITNIVNS